MDGFSNPTPTSRRATSLASSAPATHPTQSSNDRRTSGGTSPRITMSETAKRPPGLSTRNASSSTARLSAERLRSEEHTSELQSRENLVCRLLLEKKKQNIRAKAKTI